MVKNCVFCHSDRIVKNGKRKRNLRTKQSYLCRSCTKQFVESNGFERMRHRPKIIARAVHMYNDGMSLFNVQNHLWQHDGVKVSIWTISKWHKKLSVFLKSDTPGSKTNTQRQTAFR